MGPAKISDVLDAVSNDASLELFKLVAITNGTSGILRSSMKITRKQYYSRLFKLVQCGLVKRKDNKYFLTTLGKVMYDAQATIENALNNYWKIRAVDSLGIAEGIPIEEQKKLIETLIQDQGIKSILTK
jgi:DNA-binding HxlR family transcriptional regulator